MPSSLRKKIIIRNNIKNSIHVGTEFFFNIGVLTDVSSGNIYNIPSLYDSNNNYITNYDNKIILSIKLKEVNTNPNSSNPPTLYSTCLVTQQQLFNNIKFIYKNNDFSKPRLIFFNNKNRKIENDKKYLLRNNFTNIKYLDNIIGNNDRSNNQNNYSNTVSHIGFNFYNKYNESDYYKINFEDFCYKYQNQNNQSASHFNINDISVNNNFLNNRLINYNENNFLNLYYENSDNSFIRLQENTSHNILNNSNVFIYNKFNNITYIDISYLNNPIQTFDNLPFLNLEFKIIKTKNITSKYYGKILINENFININGSVIDQSSNFFNNHTIIRDNNINNNILYLSLGNGITGITQKDIYEKIIFSNPNLDTSTTNNTKIFGNKIYFTYSNTHINSNNTNYLLDNSYNFDYTQKLNIQKNIPIDNATGLPIKLFDISLNDYFNIYDYSNSLVNLEISNNNTIHLENLNVSFDISENFMDIFNNNGNIIDDFILRFRNTEEITPTNTVNYLNLTNTINKLYYDFRFNYNRQALLNLYFDITLNSNIINFNKLVILNFFQTTTGSDFTNVDCIFVYHNPETTTDVSFQYPNNNIEIIGNINIDNLSKAIELLPNSRSGNLNSAFLPGRNGSNLSRKMIQGYIGLNNIPKLLSIKPYDETIINNRGFNNQVNFNNGTLDISDIILTDNDRVNLKYESQKHSSQKNKIIGSRKNFANIVRQSNRGRNVNLNSQLENCSNNINNVERNNYITPFRFFKTGQGNYLRSGR